MWVSSKNLIETSRIMFDYISGHCSPAKLTHEIMQHFRSDWPYFLFLLIYLIYLYLTFWDRVLQIKPRLASESSHLSFPNAMITLYTQQLPSFCMWLVSEYIKAGTGKALRRLVLEAGQLIQDFDFLKEIRSELGAQPNARELADMPGSWFPFSIESS